MSLKVSDRRVGSRRAASAPGSVGRGVRLVDPLPRERSVLGLGRLPRGPDSIRMDGSARRSTSSCSTRRRSCCCSRGSSSSSRCCARFMSLERTRALLGGKREGLANVAAAGLGVATPFCSCSAVPAFMGFVAAGVPIGVTLSFLIASPLGERDRARDAVQPLRVADRADVRGGRPHDRGRGGVHPRAVARRAMGRALRLRDQGLRRRDLGRAAHVARPRRPRPRGGRHDRPQGPAVPAGRDRPGRRDPRMGAHELLRDLRRTGQPAGRTDRGAARHPALLERRGDPAAGGRAVREGPRAWARCSPS